MAQMARSSNTPRQNSLPQTWLLAIVAVLLVGAVYTVICSSQAPGSKCAQVSVHATVTAATAGGCTSYSCLARANLTEYTRNLVQNMTEFQTFHQVS